MAFFQNKKEDPVAGQPASGVPQEGQAASPLTMGDDIFQGLGENFFKDAQAPGAAKPAKKDPHEIGAKALDALMKVSVVALVIF